MIQSKLCHYKSFHDIEKKRWMISKKNSSSVLKLGHRPTRNLWVETITYSRGRSAQPLLTNGAAALSSAFLCCRLGPQRQKFRYCKKLWQQHQCWYKLCHTQTILTSFLRHFRIQRLPAFAAWIINQEFPALIIVFRLYFFDVQWENLEKQTDFLKSTQSEIFILSM